ncbi:Poly(A)+ RNA export protein [Cytidiella melzeri]|nr:Poly(A)+ RNA export protein [Cytidiella melzeri]
MSVFDTAKSTPVVNDIELVDPPADSVSSLAFSPKADLLAVSSWDSKVRLYEVRANGQTQGLAMYGHEGPVLDVCWNKEGTKILSGGVDNAGRMFDIATGQSQQVAQHDAPIRNVRWIDSPHGGILATGGWDKKLKYWDLRTPNPVATVELPERCYSMDVKYPLLVVATANRHIQTFDLNNPTTPILSITSPLKNQTRVVTCFPSADAFTVGSVEGRVAVHYTNVKDASCNYSFRCHRNEKSPTEKDQLLVHAINDIAFHPIYGSATTCGSDGVINIWDFEGRNRLKVFNAQHGPITSTCFNSSGTILAYSVSYDWHKGHMGMTAGHPNKILLHSCTDEEVKKKVQLQTRRLR